jgi:hypothetical protein
MIINFEQSLDDELIIFMDNEGIDKMIDYLSVLKTPTETHYHLMTESWGGTELTEFQYVNNATLINQVRLQKI